MSSHDMAPAMQRPPEPTPLLPLEFWKEDVECKGRVCYHLTEDFPGFAGHFSDYPLLPALIQIMLARRAASQCLGKELICRGVKNAKFIGQARPGDLLRLDVTLKGMTPEAGDFAPRGALIAADAYWRHVPGEADILPAPDVWENAAWRDVSRLRLVLEIAHKGECHA